MKKVPRDFSQGIKGTMVGLLKSRKKHLRGFLEVLRAILA